MRIEDLVREAVDEFGHDLPSRPDLAGTALRAGRRRRQATRTAVAGGAAVTLGLAGVVVVQTVPDNTRHGTPDPAGTALAATPHAVRIDLDKLPAGKPPTVPWFADDAIRDGDRTIPFPGGFEGHRQLRKVAGGYAIMVRAGTRPFELFLVGTDGRRTSLGRGMHGFAVSADGRRIAFATTPETGAAGDTTLVLVDTVTGRRTAEQTVGERKLHRGKVAGFLDSDRIVITDVFQGAARNYLWNSQDRTVETWTEYQMIARMSASGRLAAFPAETGRGTDVVRTSNGQVLWRIPDAQLGVLGFDPDDQHLALLDLSPRPAPHAPRDPATFNQAYRKATKQILIVEESNGRRVARIDFQHPTGIGAAWESGRTIVFEAFKGSRAALVRCSVDGRCERVTRIRPANGDVPADRLDGHF